MFILRRSCLKSWKTQYCSTGSEPFAKTPLTVNKMCTAMFEEMSVCEVKIEALSWSYNRTLGIYDAITNTRTVLV